MNTPLPACSDDVPDAVTSTEYVPEGGRLASSICHTVMLLAIVVTIDALAANDISVPLNLTVVPFQS